MINLEPTSGLPIELTDDFLLKFNKPLKDRDVTFVRKFSEMEPVLLDPNTKAPAEITYRVYRKIALPEDEHTTEKYHLEYDITILPPMMLGDEFNKTLGHYHANIPGKEIAHPELYEILHGEALFVLQKMDKDFKNLITVLTIRGKAGDKIIYPPNYGHIMVNIGKEPLVTANWLSSEYKPLYEPVAEKHGMAYYVVASKEEEFELVPNKNYTDVPKARQVNNEFMNNFKINQVKPMYLTAMIDPQSLEFLSNPTKYAVELSSITS